MPVGSPPIRDGYLTVQDGRIVALGPAPASSTVRDLGDVVLLPGFVNAHTHLDLSGMRGFPAAFGRPASFVTWLWAVVTHRRELPADSLAADVRCGIDELLQAGTTLVGDIATSPFSASSLEAIGMPAVVFQEVLGQRPERFEPLWQAALAVRSDAAGRGGASLDIGLSPHAPYSTAPEIYDRTGSQPSTVPRTTHWCETQEEVEFTTTGEGPFREFLGSLGALPADGRPLGTSIAEAQARLLGSTTRPWLVVHANYLDDDAIDWFGSAEGRRSVAGVVYCPRTHAWFGHPPHPWPRLRARGVRIALGTDGLSTNPDLSILHEARALVAAGIPPAEVLPLFTSEAAASLGRGGSAGTLRPGRRADLALVDLGDARNDPLGFLSSEEASVAATLLGGRWAWQRRGYGLSR